MPPRPVAGSTIVPYPLGTGAPTPPEGWKGVSVKPRQYMKLTYDINDCFRAGTIVSLSNEIYPPHDDSTTKYPGQGKPIMDSVTQVRVYKWMKDQPVSDVIDTAQNTRILHAHLVDPATTKGRHGIRWENGETVQVAYTAGGDDYKTMPFPPDRSHPDSRAFTITNGLTGTVVECLTLSGVAVPSNKKTFRTGNTSWCYTVRFTVTTEQHGWVGCPYWVTVKDLEPLTRDQITAERRRLSQTDKKTYKLANYVRSDAAEGRE